MLTTIYLLRHAAYENPKHIFHGRLPGFPLSVEGIRQAQRLATSLRDTPITAIYSSPLTRAYQTAEAIANIHTLTVQPDDRLLDIRSPLQGKPLSYMKSIRWNFYRPEFIRAGGERLSEVYKRMNDIILELSFKHKGHHVIVVSHGDPIMAIKVKYLGRHLRSRSSMTPYVSVASGYTITIDSQQTVLSVSEIRL